MLPLMVAIVLTLFSCTSFEPKGDDYHLTEEVYVGIDTPPQIELVLEHEEIWEEEFSFLEIEAEIETCPGSILCPCLQNDECFSNFCVESTNGQVCTTYCDSDEKCPEGWICVKVSSGSRDNVYICADPFVRLCRPCMEDKECIPPIGGESLKFKCVQYGPEGSFCGVSCLEGEICPQGYECNEDHLCRKPLGEKCECKEDFIKSGFLTKCFIENEYGKCFGIRQCDTECDAKEPKPEECNLEDDDCNGKIDDNISMKECELKNEYGVCKGKGLCVSGNSICTGTYAIPEICNGKDDDCDGETDEGFPDMNQDGKPDCLDEDIDGDGIKNAFDNCISVPNSDQEDLDGDGKGDACDEDDDNDMVLDPLDNCLKVFNPDQNDLDSDGIGDACDCDADQDGVNQKAEGCQDLEPFDNCPFDYNPSQQDNDLDGKGDACDDDDDNDGILDILDNCPFIPNDDQKDNDKDKEGDACDKDDDNDGVQDQEDNCPFFPNQDQSDVDGDKIGDKCDLDMDGDGIPNDKDNCPGTPNSSQEDKNNNGIGDACEKDFDGDGIDNDKDNCPSVANPDQKDIDGDGQGDACDCDIDGDGVYNKNIGCESPEKVDNCPYEKNTDQADLDKDGKGDVCDEDRDGDGDLNETDCSPDDPTIFKGQEEKCDFIDNNCNGLIDEENAKGCSVFYYDKDGDGFGTGVGKCICNTLGYYTAVKSGDCNDDDKEINPDAKESCNKKDDNCDGNVDEEDASGCKIFYKDNDKDQWGISGDKKCLCEALNPYTSVKEGDCDDEDKDVNPDIGEKCNGKDDDCDKEIDEESALGCTFYYKDDDRDGFGVENKKCLCIAYAPYDAVKSGDCNDKDDKVSPQAQEKCNGIDDNCNGVVDEDDAIGCKLYFLDADKDGFGTALSNKCKCKPEPPYDTQDSSDCNDSDKTVNPQAKESCNSKDDNCNGIVDEEGAQGCEVYYYDSDVDGFGVDDKKKCLCAPTGKYTASVAGDCDDQNKNVYPNAVESCNNQDDDCDGITDEEGAIGCLKYYLDADGDGFGKTDQSKCLCSPQGLYGASQGGDCDDGDNKVYPQANEVCNGKDDNCDGKIDEENAKGCIQYYYDGDGDNFGINMSKCLCSPLPPYTATQLGDCNDNNKAVNPSAKETCNNIDDNCNGSVDEEGAQGCTWYYYDGDSDLFGDTNNKKCLCAPYGKYVTTSPNDCNDNEPSINPNATEKCNKVDDNCNGIIDDQNAVGCQIFYYDGDQDSFGIKSNSKCYCEPTGKYTTVKLEDCNDNDPSINPGAQELCNNKKDDNCNGVVDEPGCVGCIWYYKDSDNDGWGLTNDKQCLGSPSSPYTATKGDDCNDQDGSVNPGAIEKCNSKDDNCNGQVDEERQSGQCGTDGYQIFYYDGDNDGWGVGANKKCLCSPSGQYKSTKIEDCNDTDPTINPSATEKCNSKDDNCNGQVDEERQSGQCGTDGYQIFYYDGDNDGWGVGANKKCLCSPSGQYKSTKIEDCNDTDQTVYPNAVEKCNGKDDDCDSLVDEENASGCKNYYTDSDNDGWGIGNPKCLCNPTGLFRAEKVSDCNDNNPNINPDAIEKCNSVDDDCDGAVDEERVVGVCNADGYSYYYKNSDGDLFGVTTDKKCLCGPSGLYNTLNSGDCNDNDPTIYPNAKEICNAKDDDCDKTVDEDSAISMCGTPANGTPKCVNGQCLVDKCNLGWEDVNKAFSDGCECQWDINDLNNIGNSCGPTTAIDLGSISDASPGATKIVTGKILPDSDVDWYKIQVVDTGDYGNFSLRAYDKFHVRVKVLNPTDQTIKVNVFWGDCTQNKQLCNGVPNSSGSKDATDVQFFTNFENTATRIGEGPCISPPLKPATGMPFGWLCCKQGECEAGGPSPDPCCGGKNNDNTTQCTGSLRNVRECQNESTTMYIKVFRASGSATNCDATNYTIEITNGIYSPSEACSHDKCVSGSKMVSTCDPCVTDICASDPFCCNTSWDSLCISEVRTICQSLKCDESKGTCAHPLCSTGEKLASGCDSATANCVSAICAQDSYCCNNSWDNVCVNEVSSICGKTCN